MSQGHPMSRGDGKLKKRRFFVLERMSSQELILNQDRQPKTSPYLLLGILVLTILISTAYILRDPGAPMAHPMDQSFISAADLRIGRSNGNWFFHYPNIMYSGGISSSLIAGIYKLIIPTSPENINWHIRIFAMVTYLTSSYLLVLKLVRKLPLRLLALLTIASSAFQFIQPSSELFAGSLLMLFLYAILSRWPFIISSLLLALFGLSKVEMSVAALAMAVAWWIWEHRRGNHNSIQAIAFTALWMLLFLIPSFILQGANPQEMDRSMVAFRFTYAELFFPHQFRSAAASIESSIPLLQEGLLKGSNSVFAFIRNHPSRYYDYLAVSFFRGLGQTVQTFKFMLIPLALAMVQPSRRLRPLVVLILIGAAFTLIPAWLFVYVRIRYFAKLFPALIAIAVAHSEDAHQEWVRWTTYACGIGTIIWQLFGFHHVWHSSHFL